MSSSELYRTETESSPTSSSDEDSPPASRATVPRSPRKRRRSATVEPGRARKYHLAGRYNDAYRKLFNDSVHAASARFVVDNSLGPYATLAGAVTWSAKEKALLFAALERLGKDDLPGIAKAIGSKSAPETRDFILLLQKSSDKRRDAKVTLHDIPAALEVGRECSRHLELAGEALAWFQERFDAKQEQERYGRYWLITPEIAGEIEEAIGNPRPPASPSSSPGLNKSLNEESSVPSVTMPQILRDIPEANLLIPDTLLTLSKTFFMNPSSTVPYPWPHWQELVSDIVAEPALYRTAFTDLHTLVISLTRRLAQVALIQATSRIRSQGWRAKKGVLPYVKQKDVLAAVDMLGLSRNGHERWKGVARRCGLRVLEKTRGKRAMPWDEVERVLGTVQSSVEPLSTDAEAAGLTSGAEDEAFKPRAGRSGTPLPTAGPLAFGSDGLDDLDGEYYDQESDARQSSPSDSRTVEHPRYSAQFEPEMLEDFDQEARRQEERHLMDLLGIASSTQQDPAKPESEVEASEVEAATKLNAGDDDWRSWTHYRAEWEEFQVAVPASSFLENQKPQSHVEAFQERYDSDSNDSVGTSAVGGGRRHKKKPDNIEIPIRGARAYAALQEKQSVSEDRGPGQDAFDDDLDVAQSIEDAGKGAVEDVGSDEEAMSWD